MADEATLAALLKEGQGGIGSDARMPVATVPFDRHMEQQIQARAMAGLDPTPEQAAYLKAIMPQKEALGDKWARAGQELSGIPQVMRAGTAIGKAVDEPSIPTATNAAVQTGFAAFRPGLALKALGSGYLAALLKEAGAFDGPSSAEAQVAKKGAAPKVVMPGLTPEQQSFYDAADKRLRDDDFGSPADKRQVMQQMQELRALSNKFVTDNADSERRLREKAKGDAQEEYNRQVAGAEAARDKELGRDRRFADTVPGKVWSETGGLAPMAFGFAPGVINRAAYGSGKLLPAMGEGAAAGAAAYQIPLAYDAFGTPVENPQKRAYEAYARELPPDHPRRQEWMDYAAKLPTANPLREAASSELYDPVKAVERSVAGGIEGGLGAALGYGGTHAVARPFSSMAAFLKSLAGRGDLPAVGATSVLPGAGTLAEARSLSARPTSVVMSSDPIPPATEGGRSEMARMLRESPAPQRQLPAPGGSSNRPTWASDPPEGVKLDRGYYWDASVGQQRHEKGGFGPVAKYSAPRTKKEGGKPSKAVDDAPEKSSVQIDDTKPLRYED
jgi:hypothetical protein